MLLAALAVQVLAAVTAMMLARRNREYVPGAVTLALLAVVNLLDTPIIATLTPYPAEPWQGWSRVLVYLDGALNLIQYMVIAGLAVSLAVSRERRRLAVALVAATWLLASIALAALYPSPLVRGAGLQRIYLATDLISMFVALVALLSRSRRNIAANRALRDVHVLAMSLVLMDLMILITPVSPWRSYVFASDYSGVQFAITVCFLVISTLQVIVWRSSTG